MKDLSEEPRCPFCYYTIEQPTELQKRKLAEFPVGACGHCGAVYAYDATGHDMGAAFIEGLLFACDYDSDLAFSLSYGEDYADAVVGNYDIMTHTIVPGKICNERYVRGALIFVKIVGQFSEVTGRKVKEKMDTSLPIMKTKLRSEKFSKELVRAYVSESNLEDLIALALEDSRVLNVLQRMLYTPDEHFRWRVLDMLGSVCKKIGRVRPDLISKLLGNLLQNAAYPGSSAWGALEAAGVIISTNPDLFGEFSNTLLGFFAQKNLWKEVTWAAGTIAAVKPDIVKRAARSLLSFLETPDPFLRGYAVWALGNLRNSDAVEKLKDLEKDEERISLFREGELIEMTIAQLASEALGKINK
jgi:hypothetical protein